MADDTRRLLGYLDVFESAMTDFTALVREVDEADWERPTDCPGWTVHDLVSHTAHLESVLAGGPEETVAVPEGLPHVVSLMGAYTEQGVLARKDVDRDPLLAEIDDAVGRRLAATRADPPDDGAGSPPKTPGDIGWSWETMLRNRPLDVYMHEQDVRRAVGRPGNVHSAAGQHVLGVLAAGLGFVLGKKAKAEPGQTLAVTLTDAPDGWPSTFGAEVGDDGRGRSWEPTGTPTVSLSMTTETFVVLSGGRRAVDTVSVDAQGDPVLTARVLSGLAITP